MIVAYAPLLLTLGVHQRKVWVIYKNGTSAVPPHPYLLCVNTQSKMHTTTLAGHDSFSGNLCFLMQIKWSFLVSAIISYLSLLWVLAIYVGNFMQKVFFPSLRCQSLSKADVMIDLCIPKVFIHPLKLCRDSCSSLQRGGGIQTQAIFYSYLKLFIFKSKVHWNKLTTQIWMIP